MRSDLTRICRRYQFLVIFMAVFLTVSNEIALSQISGLGFYSYGKSKDLRTGLNLTPDKPFLIKDNFELSFSFILRADEKQYFGYVFRLITENGNIDLIYNFNGINNAFFTLVEDQKLLIKLKTDFNDLCSNWKDFRFIFNIENSEITFALPDSSITVSGLALKKDNMARLSFGICNYEKYRTTDVPAMNLRDIRISENRKVRHYWPLNELTGNSAKDIEGNMDGSAVQPMWLKSEHYNWRELYTLETDGNLQLAFDNDNEDLIIAGPDKIIKFSVRNNAETRFIPKNLNSNLLPQRQAVYDTQSDLLYCLDIDKPSVSVFDFNTLTWSEDLNPNIIDADFAHYNKFFSSSDSSIYFFGGYGHHKYKNLLQKYDLVSHKMVVLKPTGDFFNPRYLAALGYLNDTVYILGGFGSATGEQILNPHSFNDMMTYSLKSNSFTKRFEIPFPNEDFAFSNSMVINPDDRSFYVLGFPIFSYNGYLQLIKGSLDKPGISIIGSQIPYQFLDIVSYSDLYYCKQNKKLLAVTLQNEEGKSRVKIYSLSFPPDNSSSGNFITEPDKSPVKYAVIILVLFFVIIGTHLYITGKRKRNASEKMQDDSSLKSSLKYSSLKGESCTIHFFGDFQIINSAGTDITRKFTPLLKELFLLVWFNSIKNDMGISNEKITEILWHGFSESSANNNKAVNIAKLRAILTKELWCDLSYKETGYWKIDYKSKHIINDYYEFVKVTNVKTELSKPNMLRLIEFGHRGSLLTNLKYEWLDEFKVAASNEMIDRLVRYERILVIKDQPEHVIQVADAIFNFDSVNEEAMENKCKASIILGRHTVAKEVYDHFCREYKLLYNTDYPKSFTTIVNL
jgi:hypothetical protein